MDPEEKMQFEYEQVLIHWRSLADIRFKLLAILPTLAGAGLTVVASSRPPAVEAVLGLVGFFATLGIVFYDQRNTQLYNDAISRAKWLEKRLQFGSHLSKGQGGGGKDDSGGLFLSRPHRGLKLFGVLLMWHDRGLAMVYSATLATWVFLAVHGFLGSGLSAHLPESLTGHAFRLGVVIAFVFGVVMYLDLMRQEVNVEKTQGKQQKES